jgi:hypothetical protein
MPKHFVVFAPARYALFQTLEAIARHYSLFMRESRALKPKKSSQAFARLLRKLFLLLKVSLAARPSSGLAYSVFTSRGTA